MSVFADYADWYDLFYAGKDYGAESRYVDGLLRAHGVAGGSLLEIGCGTGAHAAFLANLGWQIAGIDRSEGMLARARQRFTGRAAEFFAGDARDFSLGRRFDAVVSLFHVMSYQATPGDFERALRAARRHLRPDGVFVFDFWHAPGVLAERPAVRVREVANDHHTVHRVATPDMREEEHRVDVRYDFAVTDRHNGKRQELSETHRMRYFFVDEIDALAAACGFTVLSYREWMGERAPDAASWSACAILRAVGDSTFLV